MLLCGSLLAQDTQEVRVEATRIVSKTSATAATPGVGSPVKDTIYK